MNDSEAAAWTRGHAVGERELKAAEKRWQAERAELKAEVEKLRANRDFWHQACLQAQEHRDGANASNAAWEAETVKLRAGVERLREAAMGVLDAMEVVRTAKQSEGAGGGNWISRPATREHQVRMQKAYADMHKAETDLCNALKEPK
jgi:chromosome segregation ATPase